MKTKEEDILKEVRENLENAIHTYQDTKDNLWLFYNIIPAIKGLEKYSKLCKNQKDTKQFKRYRKIFDKLLKDENHNFARLSLFLDDKTKIKDRRKENMGRQIEEKTDLRKYRGEKCKIIERLDGVTQINFTGLYLEVPSKKVENLKAVRK